VKNIYKGKNGCPNPLKMKSIENQIRDEKRQKIVILVALAKARAEKLALEKLKKRQSKTMKWMWKWDQKPMVTGPNWNPETDSEIVDWALEDWVWCSKRNISLNDFRTNTPIKTLEDRKRQVAKQKTLEKKKKIMVTGPNWNPDRETVDWEFEDWVIYH